MNDEITYCIDCDYAESQSKKGHPRTWLCTRCPRLEGQGFVNPAYWAKHEPYMRCVDINGGACSLFKRRIEGQKDMGI